MEVGARVRRRAGWQDAEHCGRDRCAANPRAAEAAGRPGLPGGAGRESESAGTGSWRRSRRSFRRRGRGSALRNALRLRFSLGPAWSHLARRASWWFEAPLLLLPDRDQRMVLQAAVWNRSSEMSWKELAAKTVRRGPVQFRCFSRKQLQQAQTLVDDAEESVAAAQPGSESVAAQDVAQADRRR